MSLFKYKKIIKLGGGVLPTFNLRPSNLVIPFSYSLGGIAILWAMGFVFSIYIGVNPNQSTPLTIFQYMYYYSDHQKVGQGVLLSVLMILGFLASIFVFFFRAKKSLFGNAKWASHKEIKRSGLLGGDGILVAKKGGRYLSIPGDQFLMVCAPTRSGKGVGIVIPNLLHWNSSVVVLDIKSENFMLTSGYRAAHGHKVFYFNPAPRDFRTHRYNPLGYVGESIEKKCDDVQKIVNYLIQTPDKADPMWSAEGRDLLFGVILMVLAIESLPNTFAEVLRQLKTEEDSAEHFKNMIENHRDRLDSICIDSLNNFIQKASKERSGVKSTVTSALNLFSNPLTEAATADNDFDFRDLRQEKISIYICIQPNDLNRLAPLINLFIQQLIDQNTQNLPAVYKDGKLINGDPKYKYPVLLLLDEFTSIGKISILEKSIAFIAGYGLRLLTIIQSPSQLRSTYGKDTAETIEKNHASRIVFRPDSIQEATEISKNIGFVTLAKKTVTKDSKGKNNVTTSDIKRELILPQDIKAMKDNEAILFISGIPAILAHKIIYYKDKVFKNRYEDSIALPEKLSYFDDGESMVYDLSFMDDINSIPMKKGALNEHEQQLFANSFLDQMQSMDISYEQ